MEGFISNVIGNMLPIALICIVAVIFVYAAANKIRSASLTPAILAVKQLETLVTLAQGTNNTVVVIPFDAIRPGGLQDTILMKSAIDNAK